METVEIKTESRKLHSSGTHEFIQPYYLETLQKKEYLEIQEYISNLSDNDYKFNKNTEFNHYDGYQDKIIEKYRSCKIHYPKQDTILPRVGRDYFRLLNNKFWKYDLEDVFEFQLIKYDVGGNYNWHCDYGTAERPGLIRKLSMSIQLTPPEEYHGGELSVVNYQNTTINISTDLATVVVFDSKLPHKVHPVVWGQRLSLVGWANGPRFR
jgi:Rps23 Pro-64 3,4-dihydroxylase Tpa1-like proline 4-hydroxylase